jgi:hypothetical protein
MRRDGITDEAADILRSGESRALLVIRDEWSAPIPLTPEAQPFPPNLLPGALGEFAEALSSQTETPRELAALMCLAVTSASVAGRCEVQVHEGYTEPLNLFVAAALESGNRKTAVVNAARQPLVDFENEERERIAPERRNAISEQKTLEARIEKLRKALVNRPDNEDAKTQLYACEQKLIEIPELPRLWTQDITPEALASLTSKNGERLAVLSDEGGYFEILAGRYSSGKPNLDFVLQAHAGAPVRVDRKSGDPIFLQNPLLTIGLSPQPSVLSDLADIPGFRGRGLLARFLYGLPPSNLGYRNHEPKPIPTGTRRDYADLIRRLLKMRSRAGEDGRPNAIRLTFAPSAYDSWREFQRIAELEMREGNRLAALKDWAGKLPGAAARIAGVFHCATTDPVTAAEIGRDTTELALALASISISHTTCAFGLMGASTHTQTAKRLIRWAIDRREKETIKRDIFCAFQGTFKVMENLEPVLRLLEEHHYLRIEERSTGGRPSALCRWNPALFGERP